MLCAWCFVLCASCLVGRIIVLGLTYSCNSIIVLGLTCFYNSRFVRSRCGASPLAPDLPQHASTPSFENRASLSAVVAEAFLFSVCDATTERTEIYGSSRRSNHTRNQTRTPTEYVADYTISRPREGLGSMWLLIAVGREI